MDKFLDEQFDAGVLNGERELNDEPDTDENGLDEAIEAEADPDDVDQLDEPFDAILERQEMEDFEGLTWRDEEVAGDEGDW